MINYLQFLMPVIQGQNSDKMFKQIGGEAWGLLKAYNKEA